MYYVGGRGESLVEPDCYQELVSRQGQRRVPDYLARYDSISNEAMLHAVSVVVLMLMQPLKSALHVCAPDFHAMANK